MADPHTAQPNLSLRTLPWKEVKSYSSKKSLHGKASGGTHANQTAESFRCSSLVVAQRRHVTSMLPCNSRKSSTRATRWSGRTRCLHVGRDNKQQVHATMCASRTHTCYLIQRAKIFNAFLYHGRHHKLRQNKKQTRCYHTLLQAAPRLAR